MMLLFVMAAGSGATRAQWLTYPTPGIPRLANGAPDLKAPAPRTPDGKPDFSGMWFANVPSRDFCKEKDCIQEERMAREQINLGIKMKDGLPYSAIAHLAEDVVPFIAIANGLRQRGFSAPQILAADRDAGFLLLEDLGTELMVAGDPPPHWANRPRPTEE